MNRRLVFALIATALSPVAAHATEAALGRSITGAQVTPYVGIIPPTPGLNVSVSYINYDGSIGASRPVPIGGSTALNLHAKVDLYAATFAYIWDTGKGRWKLRHHVHRALHPSFRVGVTFRRPALRQCE